MLDYRIETFLTVCETLSYTKAADILHISQPAITKQIKYLEDYFKQPLFAYHNKHLEITNFGKILYDEYSKISNELKHFEKELSIKTGTERISIGATFTFAEYILIPLIKKWTLENPQLEINITVANTQKCIEMLNNKEIDFALVEGFFNKAKYDSKLIKKTKMHLVANKNHPLAKLKKVKLNDILDHTLIIRKKESLEHGIFPNELAKHNLSYDSFNHIIICGSISAIKSLILENCGIGFLHEDIIKKDVEEGNLNIIDIEEFNISREMNMIFSKGSIDNITLNKFYEDLLKY